MAFYLRMLENLAGETHYGVPLLQLKISQRLKRMRLLLHLTMLARRYDPSISEDTRFGATLPLEVK